VSVDNIQQQLLITPNIEGTYESKALAKGVRLVLINLSNQTLLIV